MFNGSLECELREYIIFDGDKKSFLASGGKLKEVDDRPKEPRRMRDRRDDRFAERTRDDRRDKRSDRRFDDRFDDRRRDSRRDRKNDRRRDFSRDFDSRDSRQQPESDNPFAIRRNPYALRSIVDKKPSLPPSDGPMMRSRGWKKRSDDTDKAADE